ncbi:hypothetical protein DAEQUDRAFT_815401 [Daedalea quercina L-15889]|uniref:Uncharacterized protein n=1 Tax=Daedalea quercina L-15889 TaxID=1314783 RepID=A0A165L1P9_9APHY|nr:hypothetical protein DAEQUDRAFT_815401 [Daedalea quercina L-15889]
MLEVLWSNLVCYGLFGTHPQAWPLPDDMPVAPNQSGIPVADDSSSLPDFTQPPTGKIEYVYPSSFAPIAPAPPNNALAGDEDNPGFARALDLMNDMSFGSETLAPTSAGAWGCIADDEAWI